MYDLNRFVNAQEADYDTALAEIRSGKKEGHWIWYIFPQIRGLGHSYMSNYYGLSSIDEAKEYYAHPVLGKRLTEISCALLELEENDPGKIMNYPDDLKLMSCMTLFHIAIPDEPVFKQVLNKFYKGTIDTETMNILEYSCGGC